jgi:two-component system chemotaxis response regulator CheY
MKTLIVEDDPISRIFLEEFLKTFGPVCTATNGIDALDAVRDAIEEGAPFNLVCMDIMMPRMDGQSALISIRELEKSYDIDAGNRVKIVMTSALSDMKNTSTAFENLCDAYLFKPIDRKRLLDILGSLHLIPA